jgi:hypothetical protein
MRAPLTPDIAVQVLPAPFAADLTKASIMESTNQGIARQNRIILGGAKQFVFSRQIPPSKFIKENFGKYKHPRILTIESLMDDWKQAL